MHNTERAGLSSQNVLIAILATANAHGVVLSVSPSHRGNDGMAHLCHHDREFIVVHDRIRHPLVDNGVERFILKIGHIPGIHNLRESNTRGTERRSRPHVREVCPRGRGLKGLFGFHTKWCHVASKKRLAKGLTRMSSSPCRDGVSNFGRV